ncbi:MAG: hypothetical protein IJT34_07035 [Butyrivibrio sp.]|nr:hypothetical protein [Butyrivibrio sp.]
MRPFWKQRKRLQWAGECNAPAWHVCFCDCADYPYNLYGNTIPMDSLESISEEVADSYCMETDVADKIFEQEIYRCLPQMDTIDRIIIRCMVLHERDLTERQRSLKPLDRNTAIRPYTSVFQRRQSGLKI